jgi:hypothetical protein
MRAALVDANNTVHLQPVTIGRDFGASVEILEGVTAESWLIVNPPDSIDEGQTVIVERPKPAAATAASAPAPGSAPAPAPARGGTGR